MIRFYIAKQDLVIVFVAWRGKKVLVGNVYNSETQDYTDWGTEMTHTKVKTTIMFVQCDIITSL